MSLRSEVIRIFNELMAGSKKITELPSANTPLAGTELVEVVQDGENRKVASSSLGGGGGGVQSIVAGANITVDDTDPENPIVSSSGGGGSQDLQSVMDEGATANIGENNGSITAQDGSNYTQIGFNPSSLYVVSSNNANTSAANIELSPDGIKIEDTRANRGIQGLADYSANIQANDYTQKVYVDGLLVGLWDDRGSFDASVNAYPSSGGSGSAGAILKGDIWTVSVVGTLPTGQAVEVGDTVRALVDTPGNTQANWAILQNNIGYVPAPIASPTLTGVPAAPTAATNTDTTQIATTAFVNAEIAARAPKVIQVAVSDEITALTTGTAKVTFRMPYAMTLTAIRASLSTAQATGSILTVDVNEAGSTILSTKVTIDNTEKTSTTAAAAPVISDSALADDAEVTVDIDQIGDGTAKGLKITLIGS